MDADTRHQLKQNELAEALAKLRDFSDRKTLAWLMVIVVIALAYVGYKVWDWRQASRLNLSYQALTSVNAADASLGDAPLARLRELIADGGQPGLVALARLQLAQGLEVRGLGPGEAAQANLDRAEAEYKTILNMPKAPDTVKAPATYRLAMLYETRRDFAKARETYTALTEDKRFAGSPFIELASTRLESLDELAIQVEFEPGVRPLVATPAPESQPAAPPGVDRIDAGGLTPFATPTTAPTGVTGPGGAATPTESGESPQP